MATIDMLKNRFTSIVELVEKIEKTEKIKRIPSVITNHVNNIHDEFAEYNAMTLDNNNDDVSFGMNQQLKYIDDIITDLEYMVNKIYNKNI